MAIHKHVVYSLSIVKNEADIIESFVRHNINIFDCMYIIDNGSFDNTVQILENMKKEGLSLHLLHDDSIEFRQEYIMSKHLNAIFTEFHPDFVMPLDADEFIVHRDSHSDPRAIIDQLENKKVYFIKWRTYVPHYSDNISELFIPNRIKHAREDRYEDHFKIIIPKLIAQKHSVSLKMGNHDIKTGRGSRRKICKEVLDDLRVAHFPVRSVEQIKSKVMVGWINYLCRHDKIKGTAFHWQTIFAKIKNNSDIGPEDLTQLAMEYSFNKDPSVIAIEYNPVNLPFSNSIRMLYTQPDNIFSLNYLLANCEIIAMQYARKTQDAGEITKVFRMIFDIIILKIKNIIRRINKLKPLNHIV